MHDALFTTTTILIIIDYKLKNLQIIPCKNIKYKTAK